LTKRTVRRQEIRGEGARLPFPVISVFGLYIPVSHEQLMVTQPMQLVMTEFVCSRESLPKTLL
jgi:hypothetical protein